MSAVAASPSRDRSIGSPARLERVLAVGRAFLTVSGFIAIFLDPSEPPRLQALAYGVLLSYAAYSLLVLAWVHRAARITARHGRMLHGADIVWTSALTFVSEAALSPFFLFFLFAVLAAAYRWGFRETVATAVGTTAISLIETGIMAAGPWSSTLLPSAEFELNRTILRVTYLLLTGFLLGYFAEQEKQLRTELAAMADATAQPRVDLGLGGSVAALGRGMLATFAAAAADVVIRDIETQRTLLWHIDAADAHEPRVKRVQLDVAEAGAWLFPDQGRTWHAVAERGAVIVRATVVGTWPLARVPMELPPVLGEARTFRTITATNLGLPGEWHGRLYLYDAHLTGSVERGLHFLEALGEHVTPALTNVFLLRRLRARAGAVERSRVARELHDGAIQALFGIEMKIEAMRRNAGRTPSEADVELADIQALLRREALALRELMRALRPIELDSVDQLPEVLASVVERFRRDTGISARFVSTGARIDVPPASAVEIVRIVQEALVNVRKHSRAQNVLVRLTAEQGQTRLVIEDDGCGFMFEGRLSADELDRRRVGPAIIKERARIAGAALAVDSTPGAGARVELAFPEASHA